MPTKNKNNDVNYVPTLEEYIAEQINLTRNAAVNKSLTRTMPRVPKGIKRGERWNPVTKKVEPIYENGNSCAYTFADNYNQNWTSSEDFRQNHDKYGFKEVNWNDRKAGDCVLVIGDDNVAKHTMMYDSDNSVGQPLYNHSNGGYDESAIRKKAKYPVPLNNKLTYTFVGTPADSTQWINKYKQLYGNQMKCGGRRKAQLGLDIREGGIAIPIANNMFYIEGRKHAAGGVVIGPNSKNGVEVEGGEVVEMIDSNHPSVGRQFKAGGQQQTMRVFSSVPFLRGVSPAQLVMGGANPNKVFKAQEDFKDKNRINDDGTHYQNGGQKKSNSAIRTEADKKVPAYNRAVYSLVDPTMAYPTKKEAFGYAIGAGIKAMRNPNDMVYWVTDSVSDAAWRKRHGLSYDNKFLIPNEDGSVRLPKDREMEIPTDTTMLKNRIAANKKLAKRYPEGSEKRDIVDWALRVDGMALDSLRHTYRTGEPVTINEGAYNSRRLINNGELSYPEIMPHNVMQNYAIQYDKSKDKMNYWDTYNFNEFEWGVPGKPFEIRGSIPLKRFGGLNRSEDYGSKKKPYPNVSKSDFAGGHRSYPIPTKADAVDALRLAGLHGRSDVKAKVYRKYPELRKKAEMGIYQPKRNDKGQVILDPNNYQDVKWLHEQQGKRGAKAVHKGQKEFLEDALNRTAPIMLGIAAANPITTATSLAGGYLLGKVGELGGELYKGLTGEDYTREGKVIGQTIGSLGGPIGAKLFGKGATNAWNTYKSNRLNSTQTLVDVPESGLTIRPNVRTNKPKQLDVTNNQKYLPTDVEDLTWKEPKALLETQAQVTRRDLKNFNRWAKLFGYEPVPLRYAETKSIADRHVQDRIRQHNTFLRGVAKPNKLQLQAIEYELAKEGITNPTDYDVYNYMATHSAPITGAGRADLRPIQVRKHKVGNFNLSKTSDSPIGALYTQGSGRGAAGYAGMGPESGGHRRTGVVVEVARPTNFRPEASYAEWVKENDFNFGDVRSKGFHKKVANRVVETGKAPEGYNLSDEDKQILFNEIKNEFAARPEPVYETAKHALDYIKNHRPNIVKNITQLDESAFNSLFKDSKRAYNEYLGKLMILNPKTVSFSKEVKKENDRFKNAYRDAVVLEGKRRKNKYLSDIDYNPEDYTQPDYSVLKSTSRNRGNAQQHYIFRAPIGEKILEGRGFYLPTEEEIINATVDHYPLWTPGYSRNTRKFGGIKKFKLGGSMIYTINGNIKNGLMSARPKAQYGKIDRKNKDYKVGPDGLIYKLAADGEWYTDGTKHVTAKDINNKTNLSKATSTPRGRGTKASTTSKAATKKGADVKYGTPLAEKKDSLYMTAIKNGNVYTPAIGDEEKIKSPYSTGGGQKSNSDDTKGRWIGQYKTTNVGDWIGLGSNLAGTIASYFMTKNAINKIPEPIKPVMAQAAKLKTRYNVEPQLTEIREAEQMNRAAVRRNTQSSNTSLAREQRLLNEARGARNTLYGQKENIETQLINQDRLNRQSVMRDNIRAYNEYLNRVTSTKMAQNEMRASNINNLISGLTGSVNSILGNIESRRATNNTLRAIAAANPNVDARLIGGFDYYIDPITKRKYNKNQQYIGQIGG